MVSFLKGFPTKPCTRHLSPHMCYMTRQSYSSLSDHTSDNVWRGVHNVKVFSMQPATLSCYLVPPRPTFRPRNPIPNHTQHMFLPQCKRPSSTPIYPLQAKCSCLQCFLSHLLETLHNFFPFDFATDILFFTKRCLYFLDL